MRREGKGERESDPPRADLRDPRMDGKKKKDYIKLGREATNHVHVFFSLFPTRSNVIARGLRYRRSRVVARGARTLMMIKGLPNSSKARDIFFVVAFVFFSFRAATAKRFIGV